jgi:hypothetical protein
MVDRLSQALVPRLSERQIWELEDATPTAKLYLLALLRTSDSEQARRLARVPLDEVMVLEAWLVGHSYAYRTTQAAALAA